MPVFVATRGQLARQVIREQRPKAVVAVACERDMVAVSTTLLERSRSGSR